MKYIHRSKPMQEHLDLKDFLLSPKMGNKATTWFYVDGWRICDISIGRKYVFVKPIFGNYFKKKHSIRSAKQVLKNMYWKAASVDAHYTALSQGKKRKARNWERQYA